MCFKTHVSFDRNHSSLWLTRTYLVFFRQHFLASVIHCDANCVTLRPDTMIQAPRTFFFQTKQCLGMVHLPIPAISHCLEPLFIAIHVIIMNKPLSDIRCSITNLLVAAPEPGNLRSYFSHCALGVFWIMDMRLRVYKESKEILDILYTKMIHMEVMHAMWLVFFGNTWHSRWPLVLYVTVYSSFLTLNNNGCSFWSCDSVYSSFVVSESLFVLCFYLLST